jgi:hypothetical protein
MTRDHRPRVDPVDFAHQVFLPMRDEPGNYRAKKEQRTDRLCNRNHARAPNRDDVAIAYGGCSHEAEVECACQALEVDADR